MLRPSPCLLLFALSFLTACGGAVTTGSGGSSAAGSGGSSAAGSGGSVTAGSAGSSTAGSGGSQPAECPPDQPTPGAPCDLASGQTCPYGDVCCPLLFGCANGAWIEYDVDCVAPAACPAEPPAQGSACAGVCLQVSPCGYACDQGMSALAECSGDAWQITSSPCSPDVIPCGDESCGAGEVCVMTAGGPGFSYSCAPDPCAPEPLSCQCAAPLCGGSPFECNIDSGLQVSCICPMCP